VKTKTTVLPCCILVFVFWGINGHARTLESRILGNQIVAAAPKSVITTVIELTNHTDRALECLSSPLLPQGWRIITPQHQFRLERGQTTMMLLSFYVPGDARPGTYEAMSIFSSVHDPTLSTHQRITVRVLPVSGLKVDHIEAPPFVIAGTEYTSSFLITNESNQEQRIALSISSSDGIPFTTDDTGFTLCPGCSRLVRVNVQTPPVGGAAGRKHRIECKAFIEGNEDVHAEAWSFVEIVPVRTRAADRYHGIPAVLHLRQVVERNDSGTDTPFQAELEGGGPLNEEGTRHIEFLFRGPDTLDTSSFGRRDTYYLRTWGNDYDLRLGDTCYSLSELTEQYLTARGADGFIRSGSTELRGYHARSRWNTPDITENAAIIGCTGKRARLAINLLSKERDDLDDPDRLLTVSTGLTPLHGLDILLEGGAGKHLGETDKGFLTRMTFSSNRAISRFEYIHAEPDFPGYYQDKERLSLDLFMPVTSTVHMNASFDRDKDNLERDDISPIAGLDTRIQTGLSYLYDAGTTYSATWLYRSFRDRTEPAALDFVANSLRVGLIRSFTRLSFNIFGEAGRQEDRLTDREETVYEASWSMYLRLTGSQTYGAFLRYARGQNAETGRDRNITAGLNGSYIITARTRIQGTAQMDEYFDSDIGSKYSFTASASHTLKRTGTLSLSAARSFTTGRWDDPAETSVMLEYSCPFSLPVGRKMGGTSLSGTVRDTLTGEALADVLLRLDTMTVATDRNGRFLFPQVTPGTAYLHIDASRIGLDRIPSCANPLSVLIGEGRDESLDILITRKASITGRIVLCGREGCSAPALPSSGPGLVADQQYCREVPGIADTLVELTGEGATMRTLTDSRGQFLFTDVRPGTWTVNIGTDTLPPYHSPERNHFVIHIGPGEAQDIPVKVMPRKRSIMIIEQGETIIQEQKH
jgi:hypothetical protein